MIASKGDDLPVFVRWTEFVKWLLPATEKFPKRVRFTFSSRIDNLALDIVSTSRNPAHMAQRSPA